MNPKTIICECGNEFTGSYWNGVLKSRLCPSCNYTKAIAKRKPLKSNGRKGQKVDRFKAKTKPKKSATKSLDIRLDKAWSKLVKLRAGNRCEVKGCYKTKTLNSHHIYSRAKRSVRWSVENGICLCVNHHIGTNFSAHKTPQDFSEWMLEYKGTEYMSALKVKAHNTCKLSLFEKEAILKNLNHQIKELSKNI